MNWIPDRKVWAGGLSAVIAWLIIGALEHYGRITLTPDMRTMVAGFVATAIAYIVPPSTRDIIKRLDDNLVMMAAADPKIPVTGVPLPPSVTTVSGGGIRSINVVPILLAILLIAPLAACGKTTTPTTPAVQQAITAAEQLTPEQKWDVLCQGVDITYAGYQLLAAPKQSESVNGKVAAAYASAQVVCSARPDNYASALITLMQAVSAFKAAIPAKAVS